MTTPLDIDALLDRVPTIKSRRPSNRRPTRGRPPVPVDTVLQIFLDWHLGRRMPKAERIRVGLDTGSLTVKWGLSRATIMGIARRTKHWERIRPEVVALLSRGEAQFLLEPMYAR